MGTKNNITDERFERAVNREYREDISIEKAMEFIGSLIDLSSDRDRDDGLEQALNWGTKLQSRNLTEVQSARLWYYIGNAWSQREKRLLNDEYVWDWNKPELENEILSFRRAVNQPGFGSLERIEQCESLTNLANVFNRIGRFNEAIQHWNLVLAIDPKFGMALGNRGLGQYHHARLLIHPAEKVLYVAEATDNLSLANPSRAFYNGPQYSQAQHQFEDQLDLANKWLDVFQSRMEGIATPDLSDQEMEYRLWCLDNALLLNHLCELGDPRMGLSDTLILSLPDDISVPLVRFFNQMKQEYASARWFFYEAADLTQPHIADQNITLSGATGDQYLGHAVEQCKTAFTNAYALLDKIAIFLTFYYQLGHSNLRAVNFRSVWREKANVEQSQLHAKFTNSKNWPLRGLYWLSKDIFEIDEAVIEPDARALKEIRNYLQHRGVELDPTENEFCKTDLACSISLSELRAKTLKVLRIARSAIMYLALAVDEEEKVKLGSAKV